MGLNFYVHRSQPKDELWERFRKDPILFAFRCLQIDRTLSLCAHSVILRSCAICTQCHFVSLHWQGAPIVHVLSTHSVILRFCAISRQSLCISSLTERSHCPFVHVLSTHSVIFRYCTISRQSLCISSLTERSHNPCSIYTWCDLKILCDFHTVILCLHSGKTLPLYPYLPTHSVILWPCANALTMSISVNK